MSICLTRRLWVWSPATRILCNLKKCDSNLSFNECLTVNIMKNVEKKHWFFRFYLEIGGPFHTQPNKLMTRVLYWYLVTFSYWWKSFQKLNEKDTGENKLCFWNTDSFNDKEHVIHIHMYGTCITEAVLPLIIMNDCNTLLTLNLL